MRTFVKQGLVVVAAAALLALSSGCSDTQKPASSPTSQQPISDPSVQQPRDPIANDHNPSQPAASDPTPQDPAFGTAGSQAPFNSPTPQKPFYGPGTTDATGQALAKTSKPLTDAEILGVMVAANDGEVSMAEIALKKAVGDDVKQFAGMMKTMHTQGLQKAKGLADKSKIGTADSDVSSQLKSDVSDAIKDLRNAENRVFDREYMATQVKAHKNVLAAIDNRMNPSVQNGELKTELTAMRQVVVDHLAKAQDIQKKMDATTSLRGQGENSTAGLSAPAHEIREPNIKHTSH